MGSVQSICELNLAGGPDLVPETGAMGPHPAAWIWVGGQPDFDPVVKWKGAWPSPMMGKGTCSDLVGEGGMAGP